MIDKSKEYYIINNLPFYNFLSEKDKLDIVKHSNLESFKAGQTIVSKDDFCTGFVLVIDGQLRSYMSSNSGKEITLFRLFNLDTCILSSSCSFPNLICDINLVSEKPSNLLIINGEYFKDLSSRNLQVLDVFLKVTQSKLSDILLVLDSVVFFSLESRLANYLIDKYYSNDSLHIYITHDIIARDLGSAREVISKVLKKFENNNWIKISRGHIQIINLEMLKSFTIS